MQHIISIDEAISCINDIENTFYKKYNNILHIQYDGSTINSKINYDRRFPTSKSAPIIMTIGTKNLIQNTINNNVTTTALVTIIQAMFHEERHVYQHSKLYTNENANTNIKEMAKIQIICNNIPEYDKMIYFRNPSEIDAELYSFNKTVEYFDNHLLSNINMPKINARDELIKTIKNAAMHNYGWFGNTQSKDYETAIQSLEYNKNYYQTNSIQFLSYEWNMKSRNFKKLNSDKNFIQSYVKCITPINELNVLYDTIIQKFKPNTKHYICLNSNQTSSRYEIAKNKFQSLINKINNNEDYFEK